MTPLMEAQLASGIVLAVALLAVSALRRSSASLRHAILATALCAAGVIPALKWALPAVPVRPPAVSSSSFGADGASVMTGTVQPQTAIAEGITWRQALTGVWVVASSLLLLRLGVGLWRLRVMTSASRPAGSLWRTLTDEVARESGLSRPVAVLHSDTSSMLAAFGVWRAGVMLPSDADQWSTTRRRIVLWHELAHLRRHDPAVHLMAEVVCCLQPLNPLIWLASRRLRQESEHACDDAVLAAGVEPSMYAAQLLALAKHVRRREVVSAAAPAIAQPSTLERRVVAMFDAGKSRTLMTSRGWAVVVAGVVTLCVPLAAVTLERASLELVAPLPAQQVVQSVTPAPPAAEPRREVRRPAAPARTAPAQLGTVSGQVIDPSGGVLPGVTITLTDVASQAQRTVVTNAMGRFSIPDVPSVSHQLSARLAGFATAQDVLVPVPGAVTTREITLAIGTLTETVSVRCGVSFSLLDAVFPVLKAQVPPQPVRVGGQIREPRKQRHVNPVCPSGGVSQATSVKVTGRIDQAGVVVDVTPDAGTGGSAELVDAVLAAVREWRFTPTMLNGRPVEVTIRVEVKYEAQ